MNGLVPDRDGVLFAGDGLAGMKQKDLIRWYVEQQHQKNAYSSEEELNSEVKKVGAIIEVTNLRF